MLFEPSAPTTIALGTATTSVLGGTLVGIYATLRHSRTSPLKLATATAVNSGVLCATVLGLREYVVAPLLLSTTATGQHARRKQVLESTNAEDSEVQSPSAQQPSFSDIRSYKVLDTGMSGALAGGVFSAWQNGLPRTARGSFTGALVCAVLQYAVNEAEVTRVKYIARTLRGPLDDKERLDVPADTTPQPERDLIYAANNSPGEKVLHASPPRTFRDKLFGSLPFFHQLSDEKYLDMLKSKRDGCLSRMKELEAMIDEDERRNTS